MSKLNGYNEVLDLHGVQKPEHIFTEKDLKHPNQVVDYLLRNFEPVAAQRVRERISKYISEEVGGNIKYFFSSKSKKQLLWVNIIYMICSQYWQDLASFSENELEAYPVASWGRVHRTLVHRAGYCNDDIVEADKKQASKKLSSKYNQLQNSHGAKKTIKGKKEVNEPRVVEKPVYLRGYESEAKKLLAGVLIHNDNPGISDILRSLNRLSRLTEVSRIKDITLGKNVKRNNAELYQEMILEEESKGAILGQHIDNKKVLAASKEFVDKKIIEIEQKYDTTAAKYRSAIEELHQISIGKTSQEELSLDEETSKLQGWSKAQKKAQGLLQQLIELKEEKQEILGGYDSRKKELRDCALERESKRFDKMFPGVRKSR